MCVLNVCEELVFLCPVNQDSYIRAKNIGDCEQPRNAELESCGAMDVVHALTHLGGQRKGSVTECIVCVQGHDPLTFFFSCHPFSFLIGWEFYGSNYLKC